jgi:hypothetical protein
MPFAERKKQNQEERQLNNIKEQTRQQKFFDQMRVDKPFQTVASRDKEQRENKADLQIAMAQIDIGCQIFRVIGNVIGQI